MRTKTKHKVNAVAPRLSDEDIDPLEQDETEQFSFQLIDGWLPWDPEDIEDIRKLIAERMPSKQKFIIESFLDGLNYTDISVTEKYWRYNFTKGIEFIKKELKL
jgi:DNA-directed RNA polymerase specialized sigma24 family protein